MKITLKVSLLFFTLSFTNGFCQNQHPNEWYNSIKTISSSLKKTEIISLNKEVMYNGSIIPVAYGCISFFNIDNRPDSIPFLYHYGRILLEKDRFIVMIDKSPDSMLLTIRIVFPPSILSRKKSNGNNIVSFVTRNNQMRDLYIHNDDITSLQSYWAITTMGDCYKITYSDYTMGGFYYYIPYEYTKRELVKKKLDKMFEKQYYNSSYYLLNYF